jgi:hypothetical protein
MKTFSRKETESLISADFLEKALSLSICDAITNLIG